MRRKNNEDSSRVACIGPRLLIDALAGCVVLSSVLSPCSAQRAVRIPSPAVAERARGLTAVEVEGVMVSYLRNRGDVRISDMGSSTYRRNDWMRIMIQFTTQPDWVDEVRFDCYVLFRGDGNRETMLTGSVTCTYVQAGRRHLTCLFVPPNVVERYGGRPTAIAVEGYYQDNLVSDYTFPRTSRRWWQEYTGVPDTMVTWFYTPFLRDGIEMYEQVKAGGRGL